MKRILALVCALSMIFTLVPKVALAEEISYEAQIGDTKYETYAEAIENAKDGDTVVLLKDAKVTEDAVKLTKSITLDLGGNKLDGDGGAIIETDKDVSLDITIKNGTLESSKTLIATWSGTVKLESVNAIGPTGTGVALKPQGDTHMIIDANSYVRGVVYACGNMKDGTFKQPVLDVYGKVYNEGVQAIYVNGTDFGKPIINIYEGAYVEGVESTALYLGNLGTLNVYGGTIKGYSSAMGVKNGTMNIYGGTFICYGPDTTPTEGFSNGIKGSGAVIQLESNEGYKNSATEAGSMTLNIYGGTFVSENGTAIYEYCNGKDKTQLDSINIYGGTFSYVKSAISTSEEYYLKNATTVKGGNYSDKGVEEYVADGYVIHEGTDGTYDVHNLPTLVEAKEPTNTADGNISYYACPDCDVIYSDAEGTNIIDKSEVVIPALIQVEDSKATVSDEAMNDAMDKVTEEDESVIIDLTEVSDGVEEAEISIDSLKTIENADLGLTLVTTVGNVTLDSAAISSILEAIANDDTLADATTVTLAIKDITEYAGDLLTDEQIEALSGIDISYIIRLEVIVDEKVIASEDLGGFGDGKALVSIAFTAPEGEDGSDYSLYYIDEDGTIVKVESEYKDGYMTAELSHFSTYFIAKSDLDKAGDGAVTPDNTTPEVSSPEKPSTTDKNESPKTGDDMSLGMIISLFAISGLSVTVLAKRRKNSVK